MPKRKAPALENSIAQSIFDELDLYARDKQFYPVQGALYGHMTRFVKNADGNLERAYALSIGEFNYWFSRLVEEGHIVIDRETRAIRAVHLMIVEKENPPIGFS